ncbi:hypothetical protein [Bacteroides helcogenes]|uniref:hypothetical protein n=1 Tax=Bacteroides helcogenes TaxID=290053 RepID=UPI0011D245F1|nr:hypothetical protein [Bacteroides helcogenes]
MTYVSHYRLPAYPLHRYFWARMAGGSCTQKAPVQTDGFCLVPEPFIYCPLRFRPSYGWVADGFATSGQM